MLRVADITLFYGERGGGIHTYLEAKARWARRTGAIEHHLIVPGRAARSDDHRHELPSLPLNAANGYRLPLAGLTETLADIDADVVVVHDPYWTPRSVARAAHASGALVVAAHHSSVALHAASLPFAPALWEGPLRRWYRHAYRDVDAVMSVVDTAADVGRTATMPLRLGLDEVFRPQPEVARGEHVLYAGRFAREKGLVELLDASAGENWELRLHGTGTCGDTLRERARRLGAWAVFCPFVTDRAALARAFAEASCVVLPGAHETFGLVALEAAASGAHVVVADTTPAGVLLGELGHTFRADDRRDLRRAIAEARGAPRRPGAAAALAERHGWDAAFAAELEDLRRLLPAEAAAA